MHSVGCVSQENPDLEDRGLPSLAGFGKCEDFSFFLWCLDGVEWLFSKDFCLVMLSLSGPLARKSRLLLEIFFPSVLSDILICCILQHQL